ncbi:Bgt-4406 [Blumeria graminis f. sp. tritici]|uniref:Bgt-4406 n=3 Tax=Blumeria graminis TaxID=34373 RepID=A0A9X9L9B6_BLUGR|nr:hypothetical protein BGT96224_4406 [Blumeria graminis f. sp. tritici 96224]VCU40184.1 Bgt-4406 [Blumeria graminis f. sp. tritici]
MSGIPKLVAAMGTEIEDPEEALVHAEVFLLFCQNLPSRDLGFVDSRATLLEVAVGNRNFSIHQSPSVLRSDCDGGTTGAVVWEITPLVAQWMDSNNNPLFKNDVLGSQSVILELGCGISGIIALTLESRVRRYVLSDQDYVMRILTKNLSANRNNPPNGRANFGRRKCLRNQPSGIERITEDSSMTTVSLDWETDQIGKIHTGSMNGDGFDALIACDCIYNDALISPLVDTCVDACNLRLLPGEARPTVCVVAQQLRSAEVFEAWLKYFMKSFRVWRVPDDELIEGLRTNSGFVVHIGILR